MFEKEDLHEIACRTFQERYEKNGRSGMYTLGFMDGYNKAKELANEWHYVKDENLPEEGEIVICFCRGYCGVSFCATARLYIGYDDKVRRWWTNAGEGKSEQLMDVIAWKEIVLPELKEIE